MATNPKKSLVLETNLLLDVDENALRLAFNDADLLPARPAQPKRLLRALQ
jgi:hypothetical protein